MFLRVFMCLGSVVGQLFADIICIVTVLDNVVMLIVIYGNLELSLWLG